MATQDLTYNWKQDRWRVITLAGAQALIMSGASLIVTVTALVGAMIAEDPAFATLPLAFQFVGMMCAAIPASLFMGRYGRKIGFSLGIVIGLISALLAAQAVLDADFWLFVVASFGLGICNSFAAYLRFAAAEIVEPKQRPQAISYVMGGGIIAAFLGPWLATTSKEWFEPILFAGGFVALAVLYVGALLIVLVVRFQKHTPPKEQTGTPRPLKEIAKQPAFITALLAATMGYGVMSLIMTATPLAMVACGLSFEDAAFVIQWHVIGMFLPSFFTGKLIQKFGVLTIIMIGTGLNMLAVAIDLAGLELMNFWFGLLVLGVGWNFMFIGGSSLLTECYEDHEKSKVQALNDFLVFGTVAAASFTSGALQDQLGWGWVNGVVILPMLISFMAVVWLSGIRKRQIA